MSRLLRIVGALTLCLVISAGPWLADAFHTASGGGGIPFAESATSFPFGTDSLGRPVLDGVLRGGRELVVASILAGTVTTVIAVVLGAYGALRPQLGSLIDLASDAIILVPAVILLLVVATLFPDAGFWVLIVTVGALGVPYAARIASVAAARVAATGYVQAATAAGESATSVVFRDVIPNMRNVVAAMWGLRIVEALYILAVASFLGVGRSLGESAWSAMVRDNASGILLNPWAVTAPSLMLAMTSVFILALLRMDRGEGDVG